MMATTRQKTSGFFFYLCEFEKMSHANDHQWNEQQNTSTTTTTTSTLNEFHICHDSHTVFDRFCAFLSWGRLLFRLDDDISIFFFCWSQLNFRCLSAFVTTVTRTIIDCTLFSTAIQQKAHFVDKILFQVCVCCMCQERKVANPLLTYTFGLAINFTSDTFNPVQLIIFDCFFPA